MTDEEILSLMQENDASALDALMARYRTLVSFIVSQSVRDTADLEEAVQDTFYKVWRTRRDIDIERRSLKGYISMVAKSCAEDKRRTVSRHMEAEDISAEENDIGIDIDYTDETAKRENMRIIAECIRAMSSPEREIFIERYYFRMAVRDIAERHGLKPKKVENILARRKKKLGKELLSKGIILEK
ncbi:sigma-70 family RNA polymerase sigma factor [Ruminococcus sp.]|uniref:RNA polymerase sigma factor n=1 Tax=Ruminococcus sp. TaxID=41978 RepID=UPI0025D1D6E1|nr:sigma-70 family RNA polymerase sigma factor [Ruminococcus sp.]MBQ8965596.1 sigma-70 family RNA polymerase sigma factor [Ruminococcus sp.]